MESWFQDYDLNLIYKHEVDYIHAFGVKYFPFTFLCGNYSESTLGGAGITFLADFTFPICFVFPILLYVLLGISTKTKQQQAETRVFQIFVRQFRKEIIIENVLISIEFLGSPMFSDTERGCSYTSANIFLRNTKEQLFLPCNKEFSFLYNRVN